MNTVKKVKVYAGIQVFLDYLVVFRGHPNINFELFIDYDTIKVIRPEYPKSWTEDLVKLLKYFCQDIPNIKLITEGNGTPDTEFLSDQTELAQEYASILNTARKSLISHAESNLFGKVEEKKNYIVINTKCTTGIDKDLLQSWLQIKGNIFNILNDYDTQIKIIGEKDYTRCSELSWHGAFSIYQDIINGGIRNLEDLTKDDSLSLYKLDCVIENMQILKKSAFNIHIGEGGGQSVYAHMNNLLALTNKNLETFQHNHTFSYIDNPNFLISTDKNGFTSLLREKLKTINREKNNENK